MDFFDFLKQTEYFQHYISKYKTVMVALGGSRGLEVNDNTSDYNLICLIDEEEYDENFDEELEYEGVAVKGYYYPYNLFLQKKYPTSRLAATGLYQICLVPNYNIFYQNSDYIKEIEVFNQQKQELGRYYMVAMCQDLQFVLEEIVSKKIIPTKYYSKILNHLLYCSFILSYTTVDIHLLIKLKHITQHALSNDDERLVVYYFSRLLFIIKNE